MAEADHDDVMDCDSDKEAAALVSGDHLDSCSRYYKVGRVPVPLHCKVHQRDALLPVRKKSPVMDEWTQRTSNNHAKHEPHFQWLAFRLSILQFYERLSLKLTETMYIIDNVGKTASLVAIRAPALADSPMAGHTTSTTKKDLERSSEL